MTCRNCKHTARYNGEAVICKPRQWIIPEKFLDIDFECEAYEPREPIPLQRGR